jgi:hydroxymethylpyrimidine/phosphomethylpyrimidine kinase
VTRLLPAVLVIAGADSSGGAGLARDLRVLAEFNTEALCAVTAVTAQSHARTGTIHHVPPQLVREQIAAAFATRQIGAIKIGMLGTRATVEAVVASLPSTAAPPVVLDPVLVASSGGILLDDSGRETMQQQLFPRATLITPNIPEAAALLQETRADCVAAMMEQAQRLLRMGPQAVLLKGGHAANELHGANEQAVDVLVWGDEESLLLAAPRVNAGRRGTGCALASAIAASLARGSPLDEACRLAKHYITTYLNSAGLQ